MNSIWRRTTLPLRLASAAVFAGAAWSGAHAQQAQPPAPPPAAAAPAAQPQQSPYCGRLEAQLAAFDRSNPEVARTDQLRKLEESANAQQNEIARQEAAAKRMGCEQNSFFVLFSRQPQSCGPLNNKIQQLQASLEQTRSNIERLQGEPPPESEGQRRAILGALVQNNCGPQYQAALGSEQPRGNGGLLDSLFGSRPPMSPVPTGGFSSAGSYRTICVRSCDGFYWPISYSATPARFTEDEKVCRQSCPAAEATLFAYPNPGGDVTQAMSINGQAYTSLPNAFRYRQAVDTSCSCRHPGESWSQALKNVDDPTVEQGDIVVNEQRARQMSQPRGTAPARPGRPEPIKPEPKAQAATPTPPATPSSSPPPAALVEAPASSAVPEKPDPNRKVRSVGPTFIPSH